MIHSDENYGSPHHDLGAPAHPTRVDYGCWTPLSGLLLRIAVVALVAKTH